MKKKLVCFILLCLTFMLGGCEKMILKQDTALFDKKLSASEALSLAKEENYVVIENGLCTANRNFMDNFFNVTQNGNASTVYLAFYYSLENENVSDEYYEEQKDNYPILFFYKVDYKDRKFKVTVRQSDLDEYEKETEYLFMNRFVGDLPEGGRYDKYEYYVLVNDKSVTWEDIVKSMTSSVMHPGQGPEHTTIFSNYYNK